MSERRLTTDVRHAYEAGATSWAEGPERVYLPLAGALVDASPVPLAGRAVLDLGSGTGVASRVLGRHGARPVGVDIAWDMLRQGAEIRPPGAVGDALDLPFADSVFDAVVAAFCVNHFEEPDRPLAEARRVTRPGGVVLASSFPADHEHPVKAAVEGVLAAHGYERPAWYRDFRDRYALRTGSPGALAAAADTAGLDVVVAEQRVVDAGLSDPALAVEYRLGMPHTIGFLAGLPPDEQAAVRAEAVAAAGLDLPPDIPILVLAARVP